MSIKTNEVDVLIIGAGISGVGSAYHLQKHCSNKSYAIIEARSAVGGTWDLFRYPGIRSDSDMFTFGFHFKPWRSPKAISPGTDIKDYIAPFFRHPNQHPYLDTQINKSTKTRSIGKVLFFRLLVTKNETDFE